MKIFLLYHTHHIDEEYFDTKTIGVYSTYEKALTTMKEYKELPGFSDYPNDFHIKRLSVITLFTHIKFIKKIFLLEGTLPVDDDEICVSFSAYTTKFFAILSLVFKTLIRRKKYGTKFYMDKYIVDENNWQEGFVTVN